MVEVKEYCWSHLPSCLPDPLRLQTATSEGVESKFLELTYAEMGLHFPCVLLGHAHTFHFQCLIALDGWTGGCGHDLLSQPGQHAGDLGRQEELDGLCGNPVSTALIAGAAPPGIAPLKGDFFAFSMGQYYLHLRMHATELCE